MGHSAPSLTTSTILLSSFFFTKRSESHITWAQAGEEKEGIKETGSTLTHRRSRTAGSQPPREARQEGARDSRGPRRRLSAGQRSAKRGSEEGDFEKRERRPRVAERGAEAGRGKQNQ